MIKDSWCFVTIAGTALKQGDKENGLIAAELSSNSPGIHTRSGLVEMARFAKEIQ